MKIFVHLINSPLHYSTIFTGAPILAPTTAAKIAPTSESTTTEGLITTTIGNYINLLSWITFKGT